MALTKPSMAVNVISTTGTTVQERGLTTDQFKAKFDETPAAIKAYLNDVLTVELDAAIPTTASEVPIVDPGGKFTATNVEDALAETADIVSTHTGEIMACTGVFTRDVSLAGDWAITLPVTLAKAPKLMKFEAVLANSTAWGNSDGTRNNCVYEIADGISKGVSSTAAILLISTGANYVGYLVSAVTASTITLTKITSGTPPTGTASVCVSALTH